MKYVHSSTWGSADVGVLSPLWGPGGLSPQLRVMGEGGTPSVGSRGDIPPAEGSGGKRGFGGEAPEEKISL
jgi:hypothetical protein